MSQTAPKHSSNLTTQSPSFEDRFESFTSTTVRAASWMDVPESGQRETSRFRQGLPSLGSRPGSLVHAFLTS